MKTDNQGSIGGNYSWIPPPKPQRKEQGNDAHLWPEGTTLITGDSMLLGVAERKLEENCKVRTHPGATIEDLHIHLEAHLRKKPTRVILLLGTNNCPDDEPGIIVEKLMRLKSFILSRCCCEVFFSTLITRTDSYKYFVKVNEVNARLMDMGLRLMDNANIKTHHLTKRGLHLGYKGIELLISNFVTFVNSVRYL